MLRRINGCGGGLGHSMRCERSACGAPIAARAGFLAPTRWFRSLSLLELPELHGQLERGSELFARLVTVLCRCGCARSESDARPVEIISCTNSSCAERSALEVDNAGDQGNQKDVGRSESKREVARVDKHRSHRSRSAPSSGVSSGVLTSVRLASSSTPTRQHQPDTTTARIPPPTRRGPFIVSRSQLSFGERVTSEVVAGMAVDGREHIESGLQEKGSQRQTKVAEIFHGERPAPMGRRA